MQNGQSLLPVSYTHLDVYKRQEEGKVVHSEVVDTNGSGHGALAEFLMP